MCVEERAHCSGEYEEVLIKLGGPNLLVDRMRQRNTSLPFPAVEGLLASHNSWMKSKSHFLTFCLVPKEQGADVWDAVHSPGLVCSMAVLSFLPIPLTS
ncbi:hypothetical protein RND81_12G094300 [Saponaria officinalis]|uniref:Uncharacterized protein n=1 Tax=Saponaria officinalis TaxID=3572 RepID=A0AAW1H8G1_SAPOF